jgi:hypothetical protein
MRRAGDRGRRSRQHEPRSSIGGGHLTLSCVTASTAAGAGETKPVLAEGQSDGIRENRMTQTLRTLISLLRRGSQADSAHVHFHQGPHHGPVPCFDEDCPNPRLSI